MQKYQNILLGVELISESDRFVVQKAVEIAKRANARLSLVHAIEHLSSYGAAYGVAVGADIEQMLIDSAKKEMTKLGQQLEVPENRQIIRVGPAGVVLLEESEGSKVDLIIIGSHGRHGVRLLLGSTANTVLHGAKCDVLAVRLRN